MNDGLCLVGRGVTRVSSNRNLKLLDKITSYRVSTVTVLTAQTPYSLYALSVTRYLPSSA